MVCPPPSPHKHGSNNQISQQPDDQS
uniref:Uncharacterized protein n=1 Tax=Anguilla anguilla TaxID=7936 RepID=A0A0E9RNY2_ANGAN